MANLVSSAWAPTWPCCPIRQAFPLFSPHGTLFDVQPGGFMAGQLVQGTNNAFDGLNRLQVAAVDYAPATQQPNLQDARRTLVLPPQAMADLEVHREITVPDTGEPGLRAHRGRVHQPDGSPSRRRSGSSATSAPTRPPRSGRPPTAIPTSRPPTSGSAPTTPTAAARRRSSTTSTARWDCSPPR